MHQPGSTPKCDGILIKGRVSHFWMMSGLLIFGGKLRQVYLYRTFQTQKATQSALQKHLDLKKKKNKLIKHHKNLNKIIKITPHKNRFGQKWIKG